jgi:hypothetical protein
MDFMKLPILALALAALAASADSFSGTVVDVMCRAKDLAGHTRECAVACSRTGYGLVTADGRFLKFDEVGNARALALLKQSTREKELKARVGGTLQSGVLKVESIELQ